MENRNHRYEIIRGSKAIIQVKKLRSCLSNVSIGTKSACYVGEDEVYNKDEILFL